MTGSSTPKLRDRVLERVRRLFMITLAQQHEDFVRAQQIAQSELTDIHFDDEMEAELPDEVRAKLVSFGRGRVAEMAYHNLQYVRHHNRTRVWLAAAGLALGYAGSYGIAALTPTFDPFTWVAILVPAMAAGACFARALQPPLDVRRRTLKALNLLSVAGAVMVGTAALVSARQGRMVPAAICGILAALNLVVAGVLWERWSSQ